jgi:ADP-ribose pyrophosphatase
MPPLKKTATKVAATPKRAKSAKPLPAEAAAGSPKPTKRPYNRRAKLISSKISYKGKVFNVTTDKVKEPNGTIATRDVIHHNGSIVILAVDSSRKPRDPDVILIRQYRHAAGQYLLELPAGRIEPGERPLTAAKREMIEETGFRANKWTLLTRYYASPGFLGEWMQIYLAEDITPGTATPEADEDIELHRMPLSEAMRLVAANQIHDGKTLIGLSLFAAARRAAHRPSTQISK